jgi:Cu/Ag efflux pump CusA
VAGSDNVRPEPQTGQPELVIRVRPDDAARHNLKAAQILDAVHTAYQGTRVAQAFDRNRIINLVVILDPKTRNDPDAVGNLWISAPGRGSAGASPAAKFESLATTTTFAPDPAEDRLQLKQVADVFLSDGRFLIRHERGIRHQLVTCNVRGRDVESFVAEAARRAGELRLPPDVTYSFTGAHEIKQAVQRELLLLGSAAGVCVLLVLWLAFGSLRRLFLILVNMPFALVGGVAAVYMMGGILDVGSMVGFVTLFGITTRNSIMMVSHWQHLHEIEGEPWGPELIFRGARERLAPVLMTALVTALGLLPIALSLGEPGSEIEGPMAVVILGGLITSTALNLLGLPVLYRHFGMRSLRRGTDR